MISVAHTAVCEGIEGIPVQVETDIGPGLPQVNIVGLASTTVMESRERIKSGLLNSGFEYPRRRVTVNLIPAGIRKNGSHLDLAIAMGILGAMGYADADALRQIGFVGEISLQGDVCRVEGVLPMILGMEKAGIRRVVLPAENLAEAELARDGGAGPELWAVRNLQECLDAVQGKKIPSQGERVRSAIREAEYADFSDISGQENAKRAAVIAVAGHHGLLMMGSPGCGKTMIARRIPSILPPLTRQQMVETTMIYSIAGKLEKGREIISAPPFRHPHIPSARPDCWAAEVTRCREKLPWPTTECFSWTKWANSNGKTSRPCAFLLRKGRSPISAMEERTDSPVIFGWSWRRIPVPAGIWEIRSGSAGARRGRLRITGKNSAAPCWNARIC